MIGIGDMMSGRLPDGRLVTGTVVDTGDSGVVINGITVSDTHRVDHVTVRHQDVLTSVPRAAFRA